MSRSARVTTETTKKAGTGRAIARLSASVEAVLAGGVAPEVPSIVVGAAMVVAAEREPVVEVGPAVPGPAQSVVVDLAPGKGSFAPTHGAAVVGRREGDALVVGVEPLAATQIQRDRVAAHHEGQDAGLAGQSADLAGADPDSPSSVAAPTPVSRSSRSMWATRVVALPLV